jgi:hypothetical protein
MTFPTWAFLGLIAVWLSTFMPLAQEKFKANGFALAVWVKIVSVGLMIPFVIYYGLPDNPKFYAAIAISASIWCVCDVIYYRAVSTVGAGVVTRLLPSAVIFGFVLWFAFDPSLIGKYAAQPWVSAGVVACVLTSVFFAMRLKNCPISWQGVKLIYPVILGAALGPIVQKLALGEAGKAQAPYAYIFVEAGFMLVIWAVYFAIKKPMPWHDMLAPSARKAGAIIGALSATALVFKNYAMAEVEHPSYLSVILFTDALWVLLVYRLIGRKDESDIWSGLGIVACAVGLVVLKSLH